jgi:predicted alternative tryptophan synthase beta-subunit
MDKQTKETTIEVKAIEKMNNGIAHEIVMKTGKNKPKILITIARGETKIHVNLDQLFDLVTTRVKETEIVSIAKAMRQKQKEFFKTRRADPLEQAKKLEKMLDQIIDESENPKLFKNEKGNSTSKH